MCGNWPISFRCVATGQSVSGVWQLANQFQVSGNWPISFRCLGTKIFTILETKYLNNSRFQFKLRVFYFSSYSCLIWVVDIIGNFKNFSKHLRNILRLNFTEYQQAPRLKAKSLLLTKMCNELKISVNHGENSFML